MMKPAVAVLAAALCLGPFAVLAADELGDPFAGLQSGKKAFESACSSCHKLDLALAKRLDRPGWEQVLGTMTARGASFEPTQRALMVDYLVVKSTFETRCSSCHGLESTLAAKRTRAEWTATVERMAKKKDPKFTAEELKMITAYLTLVVGSE